MSLDANTHPTETLRQLFFKQNDSTVAAATTATTTNNRDKPDRVKHLQNYTMPVVNAVRNENLELLQQMLREGTSFHACNNQGETLLHLACRRANADIVRFLVDDARVSVTARDDVGRTVLHDLCWRPTVETEIFEGLLPHLFRSGRPELLIAPDVRGHTPFDYSRSHDWPQWNAFWIGRGAELMKEGLQRQPQQQQQLQEEEEEA